MKRLIFNCTLLADVVLSSQAATEGFHESLNYLPGSKFLGLVASSLYDDENNIQQTLDLFHNGVVQFGDAHPLGRNEVRSYRIPASWQEKKGTRLREEVFLHHKLNKKPEFQLKQIKRGYFIPVEERIETLDTQQNFSIKSAYDGKSYKAADEKMYGYFALKKGSKWQFEVSTNNNTYTELLIKALQGKKSIGRSSSTQYGLVHIQHIETIEKPTHATIIEAGKIFLYADSNLCFYDKSGNSNCQPDVIHDLSLPPGSSIDWSKSQIRTRKYMTWNRYRSNRDADRLIIEKGSVIVCNLSQEINEDIFNNGIGAHRSEGFGKVLVNPWFLMSTSNKLSAVVKKGAPLFEKTNYSCVENGEQDDVVLTFLENKYSERNTDSAIDREVNRFLNVTEITLYHSITSSQWGKIRNAATHIKNDSENLKQLLFNQDFGICMTGQSEPHWRSCRNHFRDFIFGNSVLGQSLFAQLTAKIASEMAKKTQNQEAYG